MRLRLPGGLSLAQLDWLALYDAGQQRALASVLLPDALNVPPALSKLHPFKCAPSLAPCPPSGPALTALSLQELAAALPPAAPRLPGLVGGVRQPDHHPARRPGSVGRAPPRRRARRELMPFLWRQIGADDYMAFGVSGAEGRAQMLGADVAVARFDARLQRGFATDYNVTALAPCVQVLGAWRGVCRDDALGGLDSNQVFSGSREDGLTLVTYRRELQPGECRGARSARAARLPAAPPPALRLNVCACSGGDGPAVEHGPRHGRRVGAGRAGRGRRARLPRRLPAPPRRARPRRRRAQQRLLPLRRVSPAPCADHKCSSRSPTYDLDLTMSQRVEGGAGAVGDGQAVRPRAARVPLPAGPRGGPPRPGGAAPPRRRRGPRAGLVRQRAARARPAAAPRPALHV